VGEKAEKTLLGYAFAVVWRVCTRPQRTARRVLKEMLLLLYHVRTPLWHPKFPTRGRRVRLCFERRGRSPVRPQLRWSAGAARPGWVGSPPVGLGTEDGQNEYRPPPPPGNGRRSRTRGSGGRWAVAMASHCAMEGGKGVGTGRGGVSNANSAGQRRYVLVFASS
jgi:hypothetical protein